MPTIPRGQGEPTKPLGVIARVFSAEHEEIVRGHGCVERRVTKVAPAIAGINLAYATPVVVILRKVTDSKSTRSPST